MTDSPHHRTAVALWATIGLLVVYNPARAFLVPAEWQVPANLSVAAAVGALAHWARCSAAELGLARRDLRSGLRLGGMCAALIAVVFAVGALLARGSALSSALDDTRALVNGRELVAQLVISIGLGTIVLEELAFRGSLLALLRRSMADRWAVVASSVLFGAWHLVGAVGSAQDNAATADASLGLVLVVTFVGTALFGAFLGWTRLRSRSLLAPALAHFSFNASALVAAWLDAR